MDFEKFSKASNNIQSKVDKACEDSGYKSKVLYSAYDTDNDRIPVNNLDKVAVKGGPYNVVVHGDDFFGDGADYVSEKTYTNPTFLELSVEANKSIYVTKDEHHVFFEGVEVVDHLDYLLESGSSPNGVIKLYFGS